MFLVFIHFSRRNCPIAKRRLTTVAGARPDWGGNAQDWEGNCPPLPHAGYGTEAHIVLVTALYDYCSTERVV